MKKVIIIGSGIGGLIAGNLLAKKGHSVTMFESHSMPGGYTAGFYRKGFYFESGTLSFEASASIFKAMKDIGVFENIDFVKQKIRFLSEDFDGKPESYEDFKRMIYSGFPQEKDKLDAFFSELDKMAELVGSMDKPMPYLFSGLSLILSMLPYIVSGPKLMKFAKKYSDMTVSEFAGKYFEKGSKLFRLFSSIGYPNMSAFNLGAAVSGIFADYWTVKGGMQSWADVLAENFRKLGGDLRLNSYVDKIITNNGAAVGVSCKNNDYYTDYVISAGDYKKTLLKLLDDKSLIPPDIQEKVDKASVSEGFFTVYLGLKMSNEELSKYMKVPHVMTFNEKPGLDIYNSEDEGFFEKTSVSSYSPSMINPKLAPDGKSSLMLQTMVPLRWMQNWGDGDREKYMELKDKAMEAVIEKMSTLIPGLKEAIEYKEAATPLTYERFTHNTDGATSSWSWNPKRKFYANGMGVHIDTPVKNLYMGSCWAMQIGGVPGALAAAYMCVKKVK